MAAQSFVRKTNPVRMESISKRGHAKYVFTYLEVLVSLGFISEDGYLSS